MSRRHEGGHWVKNLHDLRPPPSWEESGGKFHTDSMDGPNRWILWIGNPISHLSWNLTSRRGRPQLGVLPCMILNGGFNSQELSPHRCLGHFIFNGSILFPNPKLRDVHDRYWSREDGNSLDGSFSGRVRLAKGRWFSSAHFTGSSSLSVWMLREVLGCYESSGVRINQAARRSMSWCIKPTTRIWTWAPTVAPGWTKSPLFSSDWRITPSERSNRRAWIVGRGGKPLALVGFLSHAGKRPLTASSISTEVV